MRVNILASWLGIVATTTSAIGIGLHKAVDGLIQVTPSFSGDGILLHPALEPNHNSDDLEHLIPALEKILYYSQEGHRPALHGAKHASLEATFVRGTVVLDQSDHIKSLYCDGNDMQVCFKTPHALKVVKDSWTNLESFNLATYHVGCGDETSGKRSFFHASHPLVNPENMCVVMSVTPIDEHDALESGILTWGTYSDPVKERKRAPVKGHVRVARPSQPYRRFKPASRPVNGTTEHNGTMVGDATMDITTDPWALETFFNNSHMDTSDMGEMIHTMDFMQMDGEMPEGPPPAANKTKRLSTRSRYERSRRSSLEVHKRRSSALSKRDFWGDVWNGLKDLGRRISSFFKAAFNAIVKIGDLILQVAIVAAKILMVPFGVPFDHTYNSDIYVHEYFNNAKASTKPPTIFGIGNGFTLAKSIKENSEAIDITVQCAKCGVHINMNIYGRLAFSIKNGVTEGTISLTNNDPLSIDAQFGISVAGIPKSGSKSKPLTRKDGKEIQNIPLSPLTIPGVLVLGPQISLNVALSIAVEGKVELLVGGSLTIGAGTAVASIAKEKNKIEGFKTEFNPVFRAKGEFSVTGEIGLPIALEVGIDILNGKFKKTVGLVNAPSVYLKAGVTHDKSKPCNNGVKLTVGAKNRIYIAALDVWEYDLRSDTLFEKDIACVTANGFNPANEKNDPGLIDTLVNPSKDITNGKPKLTDAAKNIKKVDGKQGFRLLMDAAEGAIMVSGNDGAIYVVDKEQKYDISAAWGTLDTTENPLTLDAFGRIISYQMYKANTKEFAWIESLRPVLAELIVVDPRWVPDGFRATSIKQLESDGGKQKTYGLAMIFEDPNLLGPKATTTNKEVYYPTVCKTVDGLRLFATADIITKDHEVITQYAYRSNKRAKAVMADALKTHLGVSLKDCATIQLISDLKGA